MTPRSTARRAMILLTAIVLLGTGLAGTASARSVWSLLYDQNTAAPPGNYWDTSGQPISAEIDGYDKYGTPVCGTRAYYTNGQKSSVPCSLEAVTYDLSIVSLNHLWGYAAKTSWSGPVLQCSSGSIYVRSSFGGYGYFTLQAYGRGQ
jgi:hypothetical protein